MLSKEQKKKIVKELAEQIKESKSTAVFDYKGLSVSDMADLRGKLRENQAELKIAKKTLATLAFKEAGMDVDVREFAGQVALALGGENEISVPKALVAFAKEKEQPEKVLGGTLEGSVISGDKVIELSKLPTREELLGKLVGTIQGPISGFVGALSGNLRNLVQVMDGIKEQKEG
ncbi:MAG: 50S ribosomal protein L10 [Candidatus Moranbacteria bacterium]|nr:50S ribosomal protein L10 [Candidatus Moranbacteria bacterium]